MTLQRLSDHFRPFRLLAGILLLIPLLSSCGNNGCEETRESVLLVQLKPTRGLSLYSLSAWGITAEGDSIPMLSNVSSPTEAEFTLQPDTTFTQIQLHCIVNDTGEYETAIIYDGKLQQYAKMGLEELKEWLHAVFINHSTNYIYKDKPKQTSQQND
jgi:hypothetical protein